MIYLPNHCMRWYTWNHEHEFPIRWNRRIGFYSSQPIQMSASQLAQYHHDFFIAALEMAEPRESLIYNLLGYRDMTRADLRYCVPEVDPHFHLKSNCTVDTALRRLMKQGKIRRVLHSRGWYQWYVYIRIDEGTHVD